ncbi:MAG TPA: membrane protein insertase YidC [Gemmatimonadaceae bacterium]|nr:membrane protein insertase YidC [Gemmatimonadaceae bacterium]
MDKRLLLFLVLAALIFIVPSLLFPPAKRQPAVQKVAAGSTAVAPPPAATGSSTVATRTARSAAPTPAKPATAAPVPSDTVPAAPLSGDTVAVATPLVQYDFSTIGAVPIAATLQNYRALSTGDGHVQLARSGVPLVAYDLKMGRDTIPLDHVAFTVDSAATTAAGAKTLTFRATVQGKPIALTYTFSPERYAVQVRGEIQDSAGSGDALLMTLPQGLRSNEADSADDQRQLAFVMKPAEDNVKSLSFRKLAKLDSGTAQVENAPLTWIASKSKYFMVALISEQQPFAGAILSPLGTPRTASSQSAVVVRPLPANGRIAFQLYVGPQEWERLVALGHDFTHLNSYGGIFSPILQPFTVIVMRVLLWMHHHLPFTYGWVVVIFGVGLRLLLWPLNQTAMRSSLRMQRLQPELQALQKKYKNNPEKQHEEMMRLYKEHDMSPLSPLSGCLPMLIPAPILYALYYVFENTIAFRGVSFLWMADIAQKDPTYVLPILMGASMLVNSWIGLRTAPPNAQTKMMGYFFPLLMTVFFLKLPAGLNLYYAVQNMASLPQQWLIAKERAKAGPPSKKAEGASLARR